MISIPQAVEQKKGPINMVGFFELALRLLVGVFLVIDGIHIISHVTQLEEILQRTMSPGIANLVINYIGFAHLFGAVFIILGLFSRIAIILQIPAILAEMYYIQGPNAFLGSWEIIASLILLIVLIYLFARGSGRISMDYSRKRREL